MNALYTALLIAATLTTVGEAWVLLVLLTRDLGTRDILLYRVGCKQDYSDRLRKWTSW